jgi:hypothetical protein
MRPTTTSPSHPVTAYELESFAENPFKLLGRQFVLHSTGDGGLIYEVVAVGSSKGKGWYRVIKPVKIMMDSECSVWCSVFDLSSETLLHSVCCTGIRQCYIFRLFSSAPDYLSLASLVIARVFICDEYS